jgi:hypothetical protein
MGTVLFLLKPDCFGIGFEGDPEFSSRGIGFSILLASTGFWMAMKGRWIGSS